LNASTETIFNGNEFCQWLVENDHIEDEIMAQTYIQQLLNNKQIVCVNQNENDVHSDLLSNWYAFSK
jgi:hypothetical protein